jgi:guanylate kinase
MPPGPLIIVSGPAGSGKSTLIHRVVQEGRYPLRLAVSATTRPPRRGERDGVDYYFWTPERFQEELAAGAFLEHARVHGMHCYGTLRSEIDRCRENGHGAILDIDVQGAEQVRRVYPEHVSVFVALPSWEMYEERLRRRGSETPESIARRLQTAREELKRQGEYQHVLYNDDLERAAREFLELLAPFFPAGASGWPTDSHEEKPFMHEELREEAIVNKVGGRFKLSTLIQKRMIMLNTGSRPLVEVRGGDKMQIVIQEILQDKIYLDASGQVQSRGLNAHDMARRAMLGDISSDLGGGDE